MTRAADTSTSAACGAVEGAADLLAVVRLGRVTALEKSDLVALLVAELQLAWPGRVGVGGAAVRLQVAG